MILGLWIVVRMVASFSDAEDQWLRWVAGGIVMLYLLFVLLLEGWKVEKL